MTVKLVSIVLDRSVEDCVDLNLLKELGMRNGVKNTSNRRATGEQR